MLKRIVFPFSALRIGSCWLLLGVSFLVILQTIHYSVRLRTQGDTMSSIFSLHLSQCYPSDLEV